MSVALYRSPTFLAFSPFSGAMSWDGQTELGLGRSQTCPLERSEFEVSMLRILKLAPGSSILEERLEVRFGGACRYGAGLSGTT